MCPQRQGNLFPRPPVSKDWLPFKLKLASSLRGLEEDDFLILTSKSSGRYIQFMCQGSYGMRAEVVSNNFLAGKCRLSKDAQDRLVSLGWSPPTHSAQQEKNPHERDPDGSPNYFRQWKRPVPFNLIAKAAIDTLIDAFEITHPGTLMYKAASKNGTKLRFPELGLQAQSVPPPAKLPKVEVQTNLSIKALRGELVRLLEENFGEHSSALESDGDIVLRWQNVVVLLRVVDNPRLVHMHSPLLVGVIESELHYREVNQQNARLTAGKLCLVNQSLSFSIEVFVEPFVPDLVLRTCLFALTAAQQIMKDLPLAVGGRPFVGRSEGGRISPHWHENGDL